MTIIESIWVAAVMMLEIRLILWFLRKYWKAEFLAEASRTESKMNSGYYDASDPFDALTLSAMHLKMTIIKEVFSNEIQ